MDRHTVPHIVDEKMSDAWCEVYEAIHQGWADFGIGPSQRELARATGYSLTTIHNAIRELRRAKHIVAPKYGMRTAKPTDLMRTISRTPPPEKMPWDEAVEDPSIWERVS